MRVVTEICASTAQHGARYLLIVNWHEGNIAPLAIAAEDLHRTHGMTVLTVQACYVAADMYGHECNGLTHGGEIEALAVLAYRPELVYLDRVDYSSDAGHGLKMDKLRRTPSVGGEAGRMTVRCVEIAPDAGGGQRRGPHVHADFPEEIYVLAGTGITECESGPLAVAADDCVIVPAGELHVTRNTGAGPLHLLCFFPVGNIGPGTREFASWEAAREATCQADGNKGTTS